MVEHLHLQSLVDIGFVCLVTLACARSIFQNSDLAESKRRHWRAELNALQHALGSLIAEAGAASNNLDRRLLQRKRELEQLLERMNGIEAVPAAGPERPGRRRPASSIPAEDLPNKTWEQPTKSLHRAGFAAEAKNSTPSVSAADADSFSLGTSLDSLIKDRDDTVTLSAAAIQNNIKNRKSANISAANSLLNEIEILRSDPVEGEAFSRTSIIDPATFHIARRLLKEGKEIHVVARKLELPVSEIRSLERMLRQEAAAAGRLNQENTDSAPESPDYEVQREMALL